MRTTTLTHILDAFSSCDVYVRGRKLVLRNKEGQAVLRMRMDADPGGPSIEAIVVDQVRAGDKTAFAAATERNSPPRVQELHAEGHIDGVEFDSVWRNRADLTRLVRVKERVQEQGVTYAYYEDLTGRGAGHLPIPFFKSSFEKVPQL